MKPRSENYNASAKFSCIPGYQFVLLDRMNRLENNTVVGKGSLTTLNSLLADENNEDNVRKIKLKDVLTLSFKCSKNEEWAAQFKMVCR